MITANELKIKGIKAIEEGLKDHKELGITVRGKTKYVAMTLEQYEYMRQIELDHAYEQVMKDISEGNYQTSIDKHFDELDQSLKHA